MTHQEINALRLWVLCQRAAAALYDTRAPSPRYAGAVARLLFGTAAQESGLRWERQRTPRFLSEVGGVGKWQVETGSIGDSIGLCGRKRELCRRASEFLFNDPNAPADAVLQIPLPVWLWGLRMDDNDVPAVLFARLHYLRVAEAIPDGLEAQARYWKRWYNTVAGKGTPEQYMASWRRYCAPVLDLATREGITA